MQLSLRGSGTLRAPSLPAARSRKSSATSQSLIRFATDSSPRGAQQTLVALWPGYLQGCWLSPAVLAPSGLGQG